MEKIQYKPVVRTQDTFEYHARLIAKYRLKIRQFAEDMWGLTPQPCKPEYVTKMLELELASRETWQELSAEVNPEWFGDYNEETEEWEWYNFVKGEHITWQQNLLLMGIEKGAGGDASRHISVRSGHGVGKSSSCSWIILWFLYCYEDSICPVTAPTAHQMHDVLWKELSIWISRMKNKDIKELYIWQKGYLRIAYSPESWFARARTSTKENTEAIAGVHADHILIVVDEASGVPDQVYNAAEGALTSGNVFVVTIGNPVRTTGYFYNAHHKNAPDFQLFHFNGEESPIVDKKYVQSQAKRHGTKSAEYGIRVKGEFPGEDLMDDSGYLQLIPEAKITVVPAIEEPTVFVGHPVMGVDPSGEGKDTATIVLRDRFKTRKLWEETTSNPRHISERVLTFADRYNVLGENIVVDSFGVGADVGKEIAIATRGQFNVYSVLVGNNPKEEEAYNSHLFQRKENEVIITDKGDKKDMFLNLRALMYWRSRAWLYGGGVLVDNDVDNSKFKNELVVIKYKRSLHGNKIQLMSKKEMLKLRIPSPNIGDAFALTFLRDIEEDDYLSEEERERLREEENQVEDPFSIL